jgi:hypothetical protein
MQPTTRQTWLWQLSYAILGFIFLMSPIVMTATGGFVIPFAISAAAIVLLFILDRVWNGSGSRNRTP